MRQYCINNAERKHKLDLLSGARTRARNKGTAFAITLDDIEIPTHCPILDIEMTRNEGYSSGSSPTLDRVVPESGYVRGNVLVISRKANTIKSDASPEELRLVARYCNSKPEQRDEVDNIQLKRKRLNGARNSAQRRKLKCSIKINDIKLPKRCPVLGIEIDYSRCESGDSASLDRWDNSLGYVPGNVFVISKRANQIKNDATAEEITKVADWLERQLIPT